MKEYRIGKNVVRIHGTLEHNPRTENAVRVFMTEVLKAKREVGGQ